MLPPLLSNYSDTVFKRSLFVLLGLCLGLQDVLSSKEPFSGARLLAAQADGAMPAIGSALAVPVKLALCVCHDGLRGFCAPGAS